MDVTVLKFGGSSIQSAEKTRKVIGIIERHYTAGDNPVVVVSAVGEVTGFAGWKGKMTDFLLYASSLLKQGEYSNALDLVRHAKSIYACQGSEHYVEVSEFDTVFSGLESLCSSEGVLAFRNEFLRRNSGSFLDIDPVMDAALDDYAAPHGELGSIVLVSGGLSSLGIPAVAVNSAEAGFVSDSRFRKAELTKESLDSLIALEFRRICNRNPGAIPVYSGFNARDVYGNTTTLGRDGSNVTALALGAAIKAKSVIIYSDDPILPIDPRIVANNIPLRHLCYSEVEDLAHGGVKAFPPAMLDVLRKRQKLPPIYMRSTKNPEDEGTLVTSNARGSGYAKAMAVRDNISYREFPVQNNEQAARLKEMVYSYGGVSVIRCVDKQDLRGRKVAFTYQVDPKFVEKLNADSVLRGQIESKVGDVDSRFSSDPGRYFRQTMYYYLKQAVGNGPFESVQLHDASLLTIVGHNLGTSYGAISKVMEIVGRVQPHQQLQHMIHHFPIVRERHMIQLIIPRGLENVASEIYNALHSMQQGVII